MAISVVLTSQDILNATYDEQAGGLITQVSSVARGNSERLLSVQQIFNGVYISQLSALRIK